MPTYPPTTEPLTSQSPVSASLVAPITVPTHGAGGTFSVLAKTHVSAPPSRVLQTIRNTPAWPLWNSFCPRCVINSGVTSSDPSTADTDVGDEALETGKEG